MNKWIIAQLPTYTENQLKVVAENAEQRILSHSVGGYRQPEYVQNQQAIVDAVQEELRRRKV